MTSQCPAQALALPSELCSDARAAQRASRRAAHTAYWRTQPGHSADALASAGRLVSHSFRTCPCKGDCVVEAGESHGDELEAPEFHQVGSRRQETQEAAPGGPPCDARETEGRPGSLGLRKRGKTRSRTRQGLTPPSPPATLGPPCCSPTCSTEEARGALSVPRALLLGPRVSLPSLRGRPQSHAVDAVLGRTDARAILPPEGCSLCEKECLTARGRGWEISPEEAAAHFPSCRPVLQVWTQTPDTGSASLLPGRPAP